MTQENKLTLVYWDLQGVTEPIRLFLNYLKVPYDEKNIQSDEEWATEQDNLKKAGLLMPNLPHIIDGDFKLSESEAIPWYIANKVGRADLVGGDLKGQAKYWQVMGGIQDVFVEILGAFMDKNYKETMPKVAKKGSDFDRVLNRIAGLLGEKDFLLGKLTYADFRLAYFTYMFDNVFLSAEVENPIDRYPNLRALSKRVYNLEGVKDFYLAQRKEKELVGSYWFPWIQTKYFAC